MNRKALFVLAVAAALLSALLVRSCSRKKQIPITPSIPITPVVAASPVAAVVPIVVPIATPMVTPKPIKKIVSPSVTPVVQPPIPPAVQIHKELIPRNIEIVRVYYAAMITGPASTIQFDINGSGFTKEFEKMITVESGQPNAVVKNLSLVTPNQIHGTLDISGESATMAAFPHVLIQGKVVFQAPEPFAVIRPGEVLNLVFTEMGESGRSGRFRVFTNLTEEMFSNFKVSVSTPSIEVKDLTSQVPFIVDGTVIIGPAVGGEYDINITLKEKNIWTKKGIIRVVRPNVGQSGLIQKVMAQDGFHRPGDTARFSLHGSGFQPNDVNLIKASVNGLDSLVSSITYASPGRLELALVIPSTAQVKTYGLKLMAGAEVLQDLSDAFQVVEKNWTRLLKVNPPLVPGGKSTLTLMGRDLSADYISKIKVELDEPDLTIGNFSLVNPLEASASIKAGPNVKPGDYLLKMTSSGKPVSPEAGSLIRVSN